jgi:hypothetical protein
VSVVSHRLLMPPSRPAKFIVWGFLLSTVTCVLTPCACGYLPWFALLGTAPAAGLCWLGLVSSHERRVFPRICIWGAAGLATLAVLLNAYHVLLSGHHPLLGSSSREG